MYVPFTNIYTFSTRIHTWVKPKGLKASTFAHSSIFAKAVVSIHGASVCHTVLPVIGMVRTCNLFSNLEQISHRELAEGTLVLFEGGCVAFQNLRYIIRLETTVWCFNWILQYANCVFDHALSALYVTFVCNSLQLYGCYFLRLSYGNISCMPL